MRIERVGSADVLMTTAADVLMFNRVAGLGIDEPATEDELDEAIGRFHSAGVPRFFVDVSPAARPIHLSDWVMGRGLAIHNNYVKLTREVDRVPVAPTFARIQEIGAEHAEAFGKIIRSVFDLPEAMSGWAASLVGRPRRRCFMAFDRDKPIGTAAMYFDGEWDEFGYAAVIPEARGRNLQSALIATRIRAARESGCRWVSMETAEETLEKPSYSLRNARKMGFEVAYLRPNYLGKTG
ncbi:MAG TPA: GNAT family N-acetyltransferase [Candidatus Limnocylindrales bacterium]|nr:GNAT family N-acetyltransferase [Candidatus Limnocylindrales bacterium]